MRQTITLLGMLLLISCLTSAQTAIDSSFAFQTDPNKKYSIYVPAGYVPGTPHKMMVGMHPLNSARWNSESWRDTLTNFAATNNLLLICPDGGADGSIVDQIDTAFTTALLDSVKQWYTVDDYRVYIMGFSMGGRGTYTYGLAHPGIFKGFIPINAAISGTNEVNETLQENAGDKPVYIVHGDNDAPNVRYYPVKDSLESKGAIVNSILMPGVGHTIDFQNRDQILTTAFEWIDSVNVSLIDTMDTVPNFTPDPIPGKSWHIYPSILDKTSTMVLNYNGPNNFKGYAVIMDITGRIVKEDVIQLNSAQPYFTLSASNLNNGLYLIHLFDANQKYTQRIIVQ